MAPAGWEAVIGLEVHVQLATRSKIFSGAPTQFGAAPNAQACPVDLGLPGVLPVLNAEAVRMAVMFGLAIGAEIHPYSIFDRKNYFYPDLPKGYQISQFAAPIVGRGTLTIHCKGGVPRTVGITRAHLEEDAGKSVHDAYPGMTAIDLNRTGTPLLEVVSEPDLRTSSEASAYFKQLHSLVRYLKICDGNLAEGSMRCDANVSVRRLGTDTLGQRTEIKNVNSFRFVERAIDYEIERQVGILEAGGTIEQQTLAVRRPAGRNAANAQQGILRRLPLFSRPGPAARAPVPRIHRHLARCAAGTSRPAPATLRQRVWPKRLRRRLAHRGSRGGGLF